MATSPSLREKVKPAEWNIMGKTTTLSTLDLSNQHLSQLPDELFELTELEALKLDKNRNIKLSEKLIGLTNLKALSLFQCNLHTVPITVMKLQQLEVLVLSNNKNITLPDEICSLANLSFLDLGNCDLNSVPTVVWKCSQLKALRLMNNKVITLPDEMSSLVNLAYLNLDNCDLDTFPAVVLKLSNLQALDLSNNQISLPDELYKLQNIRVLGLRDCNLATVPPAVLKLTQLEELDLSRNRRIHLPDELSGLINLLALNLWRTDMDIVPPVVWGLTQLEWLNLGFNQLQRLPAEIGQLINIKHLDLSYCQLRTLPPEMGGLTRLERLKISSNPLQTLPAEIGQLNSVKHLDLSYCELRALPPEVGRLTRLEWLDLSFNPLQTLPLEIGQLSNLCHLEVKENPLIKPPAEVSRKGIATIRQYFEELERSKEDVSANLKVVVLGEKMAGKTSLVRTLLSSKSTLTEEEDRTHCVEITQWAPGDNITFEVYDFGGHDVYHLTHQFFLTPDALYLLLVNLHTYSCSEQGYKEAVGFWLDTLNARVPGAVVSIVGSKMDLCRRDDVNKKTHDIQERVKLQTDTWERHLQHQMENTPERRTNINRLLLQRLRILGDVHCVSLKHKSQIHRFFSSSTPSWVKLKDFLLETARDTTLFPTLRRVLPRTWAEFEEVLLKQSSSKSLKRVGRSNESTMSPLERNKHWLTMADCKRLGQFAGLPSDRLEPVLSYLQQVGSILRYTDILELKDFVFHDPSSLIEIFKDLFHHNAKELFARARLQKTRYTGIQLDDFEHDLCDRGLIQKDVLKCMLPANINPDIVTALMQHFGLCFELKAEDTTGTCQYKIPWYLHNQMPNGLKPVWPDNVPGKQEQLQLMCDIRGFCPRGLFQRFSVGIHPLVKDRTDWKDGAMAYRQNYPIMVCSEPVADDTYITIATRGKLAQAAEMWGVVHPLLEVLVQLLQEWPGVLYSLHVTCAHCIKAGLDNPHQHELRNRTADDGREVRCPRVKHTASADLVYRPGRYGKQCSEKNNGQPDVIRPSQAEEKDISRYLHYIKENVTADWKDLAYQLGFSRPDIDTIDERNKDYKHRCLDMLGEWQKGKRRRPVTLPVLMEALRELDLTSVVDGLKSKFSELAGAPAGPTGARGRREMGRGNRFSPATANTVYF